ncbi:MAG TPA: aspartate aminotransferase family protein [Gemmatimonadaceae bacterium]|nr:aspartate aminotransferase family protein [Gemmatimonadaceae bacterium]
MEQALQLNPDTYLNLYARHINSVFVWSVAPLKLARQYVRAEGIHLWDRDGQKYYDFFSGFGCLNLGHNHPDVVQALRSALEHRIPLIHQLVPSSLEAALAHNLAALLPSPLEVSYFVSSGSEAIEASLKLARAFTRRECVLSMHRGYHGSTMGALTLTGSSAYRVPFRPLLPGVEYVPFGDTQRLADALKSERYAAVYIEPIQGQGGVNVPPPGYLQNARALCTRYGTLLVLDEVQTGMGRTGAMFAFDHDGIVPDILILAKSLGGGVMPLGACITSQRIWQKVYGSLKTFQLHGSTFSGNGLACVAGLATISTLIRDKLCEASRQRGERLMSDLSRLKTRHKVIAEVRGRGLMIGVTLDLSSLNPINALSHLVLKAISAKAVTAFVASRMLNDYQIIVPPSLTDEYLLRVFPPLTATDDDLLYFIQSFDELCGSLETYSDVLRETVLKFARHRFHAGTPSTRLHPP